MPKLADLDEIRTRNLLIRSQTPYPLGHEVIVKKFDDYYQIVLITFYIMQALITFSCVVWQIRVGQAAVEALTAVHGTEYTLGSASEILCKYVNVK